MEKKPYLGFSRTKNEIKLMKDLKNKLDPQNILNRNRIFDLSSNQKLKFDSDLKNKFRPEFLNL